MNQAARKVNDIDGSWPPEVSHEPTMSIGRVHEIIVREFPSVSQAKLRNFEKHGIVCPARMSNGYRGYSLADLERIRYALKAQRDSYLPLNQIGENLRLLDLGEEPLPVQPVMRVVASEGQVRLPNHSRISLRDLLVYTGASEELLEKAVNAKLITPDFSSRFSSGAVAVVQALEVLEKQGIEPRNLRSVYSAVNAILDLIDRVVAPERQKNNAAAKDRAQMRAVELSAQLQALAEALLAVGVEEL